MPETKFKANDQYIITYEDITSQNRIRKYTTCYTDEQSKHYLMKCLERHGRGCNARIVPARQLTAD